MQRRRPPRLRGLVGTGVAMVLLAACGGAGAPGTTEPAGVDGLEVPTPAPDPGDFMGAIDNPYLPLTVGSRWTYEETGRDGTLTITVTVTDQTRVVAGVRTTVVHDEVRDADGELVEDTYDWYAQDRAGNVWYFGEDTTEYDGSRSSTAGSWEAGVDGAMAGIAMLARPRVGDGYQQELSPGVAEDRGEVLEIDGTVDLGAESYDGVVVIADTTPLEPGIVEHTSYAPAVGLVAEETVRGGYDRVVLTSYRPG